MKYDLKKIDLHIHTKNSDGDYSESEIIELLKEKEVEIFSITDHDNIDSIYNIKKINLKDMTYIPGVELSVKKEKYKCHVLGYGMNPAKCHGLQEICNEIQTKRKIKFLELVQDLKDKFGDELNIEISREDVENLFEKTKVVGKTDLAKLLVDKGVGNSFDEVYKKYVKPLRFQTIYRIDLQDAINAIHEAEGIAVLAHPVTVEQTSKQNIEEFIDEFIECGIDGIEVLSSKHSLDDIKRFYKIAKEKQLLISGGSDYHGEIRKKNVKIQQLSKDKIESEEDKFEITIIPICLQRNREKSLTESINEESLALNNKIRINMPDISFQVNVSDEYCEDVQDELNKSIIKNDSNSERTINIDYIVSEDTFERLKDEIDSREGIVYDSFKNQQHKMIEFENKHFFMDNNKEYICIKEDDESYKIIVKENSRKSMNWIIRIIRELYLREKEDLGFLFMHGTGIVIQDKGILLLGNSQSGKTTLSMKMLENKEIEEKAFISNDRVLVNNKCIMDYFPLGINFAIGNVKCIRGIANYFDKNKIIYKNLKDDNKHKVPLSAICEIFRDTMQIPSANVDIIVLPQFEKGKKNVESRELNEDEKIQLLQETIFTPNDSETFRKEWLRYRTLSDKAMEEIKESIIRNLIKNLRFVKIIYGEETQANDILKVILNNEKNYEDDNIVGYD